jgi:hypothetical protein
MMSAYWPSRIRSRHPRLWRFLIRAWGFAGSLALISLILDAVVWRPTTPESPMHRAVMAMFGGVLFACIFIRETTSAPSSGVRPPDHTGLTRR